jgi:hypothetical protein
MSKSSPSKGTRSRDYWDELWANVSAVLLLPTSRR